jgi:hypothetical protein
MSEPVGKALQQAAGGAPRCGPGPAGRSPAAPPLLFRLPSALTDVRPEAVAWVLEVDVWGTVRHHLHEGIGKLSVISEKERYRVGGRQPLGVKTSPQVGDQQVIDGQNTIPVEAFLGLPS